LPFGVGRARRGAREVEIRRRLQADHAAQRAQDAARLGGGGDEGLGVGVGKENRDLAGKLRGGLDLAAQPGPGFAGEGVAGEGGPGTDRAGPCGAAGARTGKATRLPAHGQAIEAANHPGKATVDQHQKRRQRPSLRGVGSHGGAQTGDDAGEGVGQGCRCPEKH